LPQLRKEGLTDASIATRFSSRLKWQGRWQLSDSLALGVTLLRWKQY
jgi:hypothetical protein